MPQWFNKEFFFNIYEVIKYENLKPTLDAKVKFWELNIDDLKSMSIDSCIIDINQTLVPYGSFSVPPEVRDKLIELRKEFRLCALSNYAGTQNSYESRQRAEKVVNELGLHVVKINRKKPSKEGYLLAMNFLNSTPSKCVVIGDRIFTDIVGANVAGMRSILVEPLDHRKDPLSIAFYRRIERSLLHFWTH